MKNKRGLGFLIFLILVVVLIKGIMGEMLYLENEKFVDTPSNIGAFEQVTKEIALQYPSETGNNWDKLDANIKQGFVEEAKASDIDRSGLTSKQLTETPELSKKVIEKNLKEIQKTKDAKKTITEAAKTGYEKTIEFDSEVKIPELEFKEEGGNKYLETSSNHRINLNEKNLESRIYANGDVVDLGADGNIVKYNGQNVLVSGPTETIPCTTGQCQIPGENTPASPGSYSQSGGSGEGGGGSSGGGGGGGGSSGGGGGGGGEIGQELMNAVSQGLSFAQQIGEGLKPKEDQSPASQPDPSMFAVDRSPLAELYPGMGTGGRIVGNGELTVTKTSAGTEFIYNQAEQVSIIGDGGTDIVTVANTDGNEGALMVSSGSDLKKIETTNSITAISKNDEYIADVYTPSIKTNWILDPESGEPLETSSLTSQLSSEYSGMTGLAIGNINSNQYVNFIQHNLGLGGQRILVNAFKSFDKVEGDGSKLWVKDGESYIKFDGIKIYYSRKIGKTPYSFGGISNARDNENKYSLIKYKENKARLIDERTKTSVGDLAVNHPRNHNIKIAKIRENMWVDR